VSWTKAQSRAVGTSRLQSNLRLRTCYPPCEEGAPSSPKLRTPADRAGSDAIFIPSLRLLSRENDPGVTGPLISLREGAVHRLPGVPIQREQFIWKRSGRPCGRVTRPRRPRGADQPARIPAGPGRSRSDHRTFERNAMRFAGCGAHHTHDHEHVLKKSLSPVPFWPPAGPPPGCGRCLHRSLPMMTR
jgi:hypothetical protein